MTEPVPTIAAVAADLRAGRLTAGDLVARALTKAAEHAGLNAIAELNAERALALAERQDRLLASGQSCGPLHGIPLTVKDLFQVDGSSTRAGTRAPLPALSPSTAVSRLEQAGGIVIAKTNLHEVALGLTGENEWTGDVRNPHDPDRQSGGSSSGSAVAVAAEIGLASLGTDTGGSIRVPASNCGVVGFKPTHGLVPLEGALPLSPTCDHAGPIARSIEDARRLTEVLAAQELPLIRVSKPRLAVPAAYLKGRLHPSLRRAFDELLEELKAAGADVPEIEIPELDLTVPAYTAIVRREAAQIHAAALADAPGGFSAPVRTALESGAAMSGSDYHQALRVRHTVTAGLRRAFEASSADALILPTTPAPPIRRGEQNVLLESGMVPYREAQLALTAPFSMAGTPVAAIPFATVDMLPVGLQIVTRWGQDALALGIASWMERRVAAVTGTKEREPPQS